MSHNDDQVSREKVLEILESFAVPRSNGLDTGDVHRAGVVRTIIGVIRNLPSAPPVQAWTREELAKALCVERYRREGCRSEYGAEVWAESKAVREHWLVTADIALSRRLAPAWRDESEMAEAILPTLKDQLWEASENPAWQASDAALAIARTALSKSPPAWTEATRLENAVGKLLDVYAHLHPIDPAPWIELREALRLYRIAAAGAK